MTIDSAWGWGVLLGVLGLVFGSFIATLAIRWPAGREIGHGRSECDSCGKGLRAGELVPVLSYLLQRGRCRGCGAPIRMSHLLTELVGGAIGVAAAIVSPDPAGAAGAVFGWLLLTLAALDVAALWLPNALTATLAATGLGTGLLGLGPPLDERLIGGAAGFGVLWLVAWSYKRLRGRQGLGGGDPKLFGGIGLWLGWHALPLVLLAACLIGLAGVLGLMVGGHRVTATDRLPFGVMLAAAAFAVWLGLAIGPIPV
ncbi:leader peptidase (prepilin peptidase)/N-methyltransferase [Sphingomonas kyeonggiensis]|uniref:prepilin peptidase n=1 Tax=Sphingomonas kyeonggiensis TaxID=1268553 RepID=UPI0027825467|nr:A24 family peptidase [Sphingomonas kyeonggiensis]MDQ0251375.1 leader peptidase (prepilin peptidase)/N-methyltransferase [Sphingomonas kyeonggiensis]